MRITVAVSRNAGTPGNQDGTVDLTFIHDISVSITHYFKKDATIFSKGMIPVEIYSDIKSFPQRWKPPNLYDIRDLAGRGKYENCDFH